MNSIYVYLVLCVNRQYWKFAHHFQKIMRRQVNQQNLSRVYRQFSRQRYNKYKHQFPRMREADTVLKIIKEWERMDHPQKLQLSQSYQRHKFIPNDEGLFHSKFESPHKTPYKVKDVSIPTTQKTKPIVSQFKAKQVIQPYHQEDSEFNRYSEKLSDQIRSDKSSYSLLVAHDSPSKQEKADLPKNHQYIVFYKYHYSKLSKKHQKWSAAKLSQIIKLLWMKRQRLIKKSYNKFNKKITKIPQQTATKKITGRALFIKIKVKQGFSKTEADAKWKKLPMEAKRMFSKWGYGETDQGTFRSSPTSTVVLKSQMAKVTLSSGCQSLQYMHKLRKD